MSWKSFDFECQKCKHVFNDLVAERSEPDPCPNCGESKRLDRLFPGPATLSTIIPAYPGSKQFKAGYQHSHNRPAEKAGTQVSMLPSKRR